MSAGSPKSAERSPREERRRAARRASQPREESWFGALGVAGDTQAPDDGWVDAPESRHDGDWQAVGAKESESRFLSRQARRIVGSGQSAFQRIYGAFLSARATLGLALVLSVVISSAFGNRPPLLVAVICIAYAAVTCSMWLFPRVRPSVRPSTLARLRSPQWLATIGVDIVCFVSLHAASQVLSLNYVALLVLPVLMAGVLTPRLMAFATTAFITLALLSLAAFGVVKGGDLTVLLTQAGLAGAGLFVVTILAGELAGRLAREELTARGSLELARQQALLNRLVIEEMTEGVIVVDRRGRVRAANPAARGLLVTDGLSSEAPFQLWGVDAWSALVKSVERAFSDGRWPEGGRDVVLTFDTGVTRTLRLRVRFTRRRESNATEELCVLFLEDVRSVQARTRQEKLAAMGRVSAGIAHEIRNPLAAISQANALMAEDATTPSQRQLTRMVTDNVERLKRIVDDVMEVAPGAAREPEVIDVTALLASTCSEWARTVELPLGEQSVLRVDLPTESVGVLFDPEHLRRVLVNLLDNAKRHASGVPGAVRVRLSVRDESRAVVSVLSDGLPIPPDVERYLFEPFFSTRSRGTGLGLYICRELCERYGARIDYRVRPPAEPNRNEFFVAMRRQPLPTGGAGEARLHLTS